jgi:hypothetical protein
VLVVLVDRKNVERGVTSIFGLDLQDTRTFHAVTAIRALGDSQVARRDVAVITFRAEPLRLPSPD